MTEVKISDLTLDEIQPTDFIPFVRPGTPSRTLRGRGADIIAPAQAAAAAAQAAADEIEGLINQRILLENGQDLLLLEGGAGALRQDGSGPVVPTFADAVRSLPALGALAGDEPLVASRAGSPGTVAQSELAAGYVARGVLAAADHVHATDDFRRYVRSVVGPDTLGLGQRDPAFLGTGFENYSIGGHDTGRRIRAANGVAKHLDCTWLSQNIGDVTLEVQAGTVLLDAGAGQLWGDNAPNWTSARYLSAAAGALLRLTRGQGRPFCIVEQGPIPTVPGAPVVPSASHVIGMGGQSWAVREAGNGSPGFQEQLAALGSSRFAKITNQLAVGGSSICIGGSGSFWWDYVGGLPSSMFTAQIAALQAWETSAGQTVTDVCWMNGANDWPVFAEGGPVNVGTLGAAYASVFAHWRAQLSRPALRFYVTPATGFAEPNASSLDDRKAYAQRRAQLDSVLASASTFRGPDIYDMPHPWDDPVHHTIPDQNEHMRRFAQFYARFGLGQNVFVGPRITGFARIAPRRYQFTIAASGGWSPAPTGFAAFNKPARPLGFAVLPGGNLWAEPIPITRYEWSGDNLIVTTATDDALAIGAYPWGNLREGSNRLGDFIRARHLATGLELPLVTYHPNTTI